MSIYLKLFGIFFKIGLFTIGGGYAMIPLIENEIVTKRQWIKKEEFLDLLAISQTAPGVMAINIAIFIGYRLRKVKGSLFATLGVVMPSFVIILTIAMFFHSFKENPVVEKIFKGIRPGVVALIAAPTFNMAKMARINRYTIWIPVVSALLIWLLDVSPIWIIVVAGTGGFLWGKICKKRVFKAMIYLQLFYTFFKIGLFGFGGGYGMLSLIQAEVVTNHEWMHRRRIYRYCSGGSQMTPGPIGINASYLCWIYGNG